MMKNAFTFMYSFFLCTQFPKKTDYSFLCYSLCLGREVGIQGDMGQGEGEGGPTGDDLAEENLSCISLRRYPFEISN